MNVTTKQKDPVRKALNTPFTMTGSIQSLTARLLSAALVAVTALCAGQAMAADVYLQTQRIDKAMPDGSTVPMWVFAECDTTGFTNCGVAPNDAPDAPGPVIEIDSLLESSLTIHVQNTLPTPVSMVVPGQAGGGNPVRMVNGRVQSFTAEVAASDGITHGEGSYLISPLKAGTYLYQSGTFPSLQLPMGLYGALVVTDGSEPATDEVVLFSEIDPVQNRRVDTASLAGPISSVACIGLAEYATDGTVGYPCSVDYNPRHLLVNGGAGFNLSVASTGVDVLLRWVNAGLKMHTASIVGLEQSVIAEDGNPYPGLPRTQSVVMLPPLGTKDATATMPASDVTLSLFDRQPGFRNDSELASQATETGPGMSLGGITVGLGSALVTASSSGVANDEYNVTEDDNPYSGSSVLANDTPANTPVALGVAAQPSHGALTLNGDGSFDYTPDADFSGLDQFTYTNNGELGHVTLNVSYVNDAPVANPDSYGANTSGSSLVIAAPGILANDKDADGDALYAKIEGPIPAGLALLPDGSFTYSGGVETFSYRACDDAGLTSCSTATASVDLPETVTPSGIALNVQDQDSVAVTAYKWLVEEDAMWYPDTTLTPADPGFYDVLALNFHKSYMPVVAQGTGAAEFAALALDQNKKYYVTVLPDDGTDASGHTIGSAQFTGSDAAVTVEVYTTPTETAQISVFVHNDNAPTNAAWDNGEAGLGGFQITLEDAGGRYGASAGLLSYDAFGLPLTNALDCFGGTPPKHEPGVILTCPDTPENQAAEIVGQALIKNLYPGKYGVIVTAPVGEVANWKQTSTIEGTKVIDAWVKAGEPPFFQEFGPPGFHAIVGFVNADAIKAAAPVGSGGVEGCVTNAHISRPPLQTIWDSGSWEASMSHTLPWISINSAGGQGPSFAVVKAGGDGCFTVSGLPDGDYQAAIFDEYLDVVIGYRAFSVAGGSNAVLGNVPVFNWFSRNEHMVFKDDGCASTGGGGVAGDAIKQDCEAPLTEQAINLRWRDGTVYQSFPTDGDGFVPFDQTFPFFHWQVAEVDYTRFKPTGVTVTVDNGGDVSGGPYPGLLYPQTQDPTDPANDNTSPDQSFRTELGSTVLLEGFQGFLGQTNLFQWGKVDWPEGENGGISGIVYYASTRAENDPALAAGEPWEPGVPGVTMRLYRKVTTPPIGLYAGALSTVGIAILYSDPVLTAASLLGDGDYTLTVPVTTAGTSYRVQLGVMDLDEFVVLAEDYNTSPAAGMDAKVRFNVAGNNPYIGAPVAIRLIANGVTFGPVNVVRNASSLALINEVQTDSWDDPDSLPDGCPGADQLDNLLFGGLATDPPPTKCYDGLRNFNQVRPGVFDGGYAFNTDSEGNPLKPGMYVVEAVPPPGYEILKEEDKNVGFGESYSQVPVSVVFPTGGTATIPDTTTVFTSLQGDVGLAQPRCVGALRTVPAYLSLFPVMEEAPFAGVDRPLCDRKEVLLVDKGQSAADFWLLTHAPIAGHFVGMILDDTAVEFNVASPTFGEKYAPPYVPVAIRRGIDGKEIGRVVSDQYGRFNGLVPSTISAYVPSPSGYMPQMLTTCMNDPGPIPDLSTPDPNDTMIDPNFNPAYSNFCYTFQYMPGTTTYLDTPVLPVSAFASGDNPPDCALPTTTPKISRVDGSGDGPLVPLNGTLTIYSQGVMSVPNPAYTGALGTEPKLIDRDYGFGTTEGTVTLNGVPLTIVPASWTDTQVQVIAPATATTGQLMLTRGDNGLSTENGITVTVTNSTAGVIRVPADQPTIQDAINNAARGDLVLVSPGVYNEQVIMWNPVRLQGSGNGSTIINGTLVPTQALAEWRQKMDCFYGIGTNTGCASVGLPNQKVVDSLPNQPDGAVGYDTEEGATITVVAPFDTMKGNPNSRPPNRFDNSGARIDGFAITGGSVGGGVFVNGYAHDLNISNNDIFTNSGGFSGGIRIGRPGLELFDPQTQVGEDTYGFNQKVSVAYNSIRQNGSLAGAGAGVSMMAGSDQYSVSDNTICGNFTSGDGGGIGHLGLSDGGHIERNTIVLNQNFNQGSTVSGGGIFVGGEGNGAELTFGAGTVHINDNLIQRNQAAAGHGGGVRLQAINGADVVSANNPGGLFKVTMVNDIIVDNVAGWSGGGVSLQDAPNVSITNSTIAHNDSTATAGPLITVTGGVNSSIAQPAGVSAQVHSGLLDAAIDAKNGNQWNNFRNYSNPAIQNSIVWENRAFSYLADGAGARLVPELSAASGVCAAGADYMDFGVLSGGYTLDRISTSLLTTGGGDPAFVAENCNGARDGSVGPIGVFPAVDEAGAAWIDVRFGPLAVNGDYHIGSGSTAIDSANDAVAPPFDIDGDARPNGAHSDIGADEYIAP